MTAGSDRSRVATTWRHVLLITALCVVAYLPGLTTHGLTNWQESIRLVVAREMQAAGNWITPILHGEPYLAKPPVIYWAQMLIAGVRGTALGLFELRLTVALAGWLGALATYAAARVLLRPAEAGGRSGTPGQRERLDAWSLTASFWAGAFAATGILITRSSRIGELDILLLPCTGLGVAAFHAAWSRHLRAGETGWIAIAIGLAAVGAATLVKGPPGFATMLIALLGAVLLHGAFAGRARPGAAVLASGAFAGAGFAAYLFATRELGDYRDALGILIHGLLAGGLVVLLVRLASSPRDRLREVLVGLLRSGVLLGAAAGLATLWLWAKAVEADVGADVVATYAARESGTNLQPFVPYAPVRNLEALAYGVGLGSFAAIVGVVWLIKDRPRFSPGWWTVLAWIGLGFALFSVAGRGTHRYLLPVLPGVAILGGMWFASALRDFSCRVWLRRGAALAVGGLAAFQGYWYGFGRETAGYDVRSPRDLIAELLETPGVEADRLGVLGFWTGALDHAAGQPVEPYSDPGAPQDIDFPHVPRSVLEIRERLEGEGGSWTLLIRAEQPPSSAERTPPIERLRLLGFGVEPIPLEAGFLIDKRSNPVRAVRVTAPERSAD